MIEESRAASNKRRLMWRLRCRDCLSAHIKESLELDVRPDKIRLQPDDETPYAWQVDDPDLKPFFEKSLSKHSLGVYMELCSAVGKSFRAVHRGQAVNARGDKLKILEEEKISLEKALGAAMEQSQNLREEKLALEKQLWELEENAAERVKEMERRYMSLEMSANQHQRETKEWMSVAECYERTYNQCSAGLSQAIVFLQSVSAGTSLPNGDVKTAGYGDL
ncbi:hypothetical protein BJX64DRAFT_291123 [Aspergillus heterothallicus]